MSKTSLSCYEVAKLIAPTEIKLIPTELASPRGIFIVSHGLNNRPEVMDELSALLNTLGFNVLRITLAGHASNQEWPKDLSSDNWLIDIKQTYCKARNEFPDLKVYALGYSLGAAATLAAMHTYQELHFEKLIFLAPAIELKSKALFVKALTIFSFTGLSIPSLAPVEYRAHARTSLKAYAALFDTIHIAKELRADAIKESTLIFQSREDELIDYNNTTAWAIETFFNSKIIELSVNETRSLPKHLMIDRRSTTTFNWNLIAAEIRAFLQTDVAISNTDRPTTAQT